MPEAVKRTITLYSAKNKINEFMSMFDMRPKQKWFVEPLVTEITTTSPMSPIYFHSLIDESLRQKDTLGFWFPAVSYNGEMFVHPSVWIISDGKKELFVYEFNKHGDEREVHGKPSGSDGDAGLLHP